MTETKFNLASLIGQNELLTSSALISRCVNAGYESAHARQIVRRNSARDGVWRSDALALPNNGRLFSQLKAVGSLPFIDQLIPILAKERPGLHRLLRKLLIDEVVMKPHAEMLLACPIKPTKARYPSYYDEVLALENVAVGRAEAIGSAEERIVLKAIKGTTNVGAISLNAQTALMIEGALTDILLNHLRLQNFVSWNTVIVRESWQYLVPFNEYPFSAATFSWLSPLLRWQDNQSKPKPTPVVFHVSSNQCTLWDVEGFVARMERAGSNKTSKMRMLGIMAAPDFDPEAFKKAKSEGFLVINLQHLFGNPGFEVLVQVQNLLCNVAGNPAKANDDGYLELAKTLEELNTHPFIAELKSLAFETLSAFVIRLEGWEEVQLNLKVPLKLPEGFSEREVDVSAQKYSWDHVFLMECKAEAAGKPLSGEYVRKFFTETVPAFLAAKTPTRNPSICRAEIWTTGVVSEAARNALKELKLGKFILPKLVGRDEIILSLPRTLESTKRLINTIAEGGRFRIRFATPAHSEFASVATESVTSSHMSTVSDSPFITIH